MCNSFKLTIISSLTLSLQASIKEGAFVRIGNSGILLSDLIIFLLFSLAEESNFNQ